MFSHEIWNRVERAKKSIIKQRKALGNKGFTLLETMTVVALLAIVLGFAVVGINAYFEAAEQLERSEIAETSFYSIQSHVNYLKRQGQLEEFEKEIIAYNETVYGQNNILSTAENRSIIELNYTESEGAGFYIEEYYPHHEKSEIIYIPLDKEQADRVNHPLYGVLEAALQNEEAMENSFLVEYDMSTGVVRSVFYSEKADKLTLSLDNGRMNKTDCVFRDAESLVNKKQGYYGLIFTAAGYEQKAEEILVPAEVKLINGDRLYLSWKEENNDNPSFMSGACQIEELIYTISLYDQNDNVIAVYEIPRAEIYGDTTGTEAAILNYLDDYVEPVEDVLTGSTKTARVGYSDMSYEEAPDGISGEHYYLLLECLDHPFLENGYDFSPEDTIYATLELSYGEDGKFMAEEIIDSNTESAFYAQVEDASGAREFGIACSRHLWNIRNGYYDGDYRLIADIDWTNIEGRAKNIAFTSTQFEDEEVPGVYHSFEGTFTGEKTGDAAESDIYRYSCYEINGVSIVEEENQQVGLFTVNRGTIENIILNDFIVKGANKAGAVAGINMGTIQDVFVLDVTAEGNEEIGGLVGDNEGTIDGCTVITGRGNIVAVHTVGGVAGNSSGTVTDTRAACQVMALVPGGTDKISDSNLGRYAGGVIGYMEAGASATNLFSGVMVDKAIGMPLVDGSASAVEEAVIMNSDVTGVSAIGGVIGEIANGAGEITNLYNYAKLNAQYISTEDRVARNDAETYIYMYFGGITGRVYASNTLKNCVNYMPVSMQFTEDGVACDSEEIYTYITEYATNSYYYNNPRHIGGIAGYNQGKVEDCISVCEDYKTFEEEAMAYYNVATQNEDCYVGFYVGGLIGYNEGALLLTDKLSVDVMPMIVRGMRYAGGLVGYANKGSIVKEGSSLTVEGVVASQQADAGGVVAYIRGGTISGSFVNAGYVMGEKNAGGITGYLNSGVSLANCTNTGIVYVGCSIRDNVYGGGIAGKNYGTLEDCSNLGIVTAHHLLKDIMDISLDTAASYAWIGGVAGANSGTIENCHSRLNDEKSNYLLANTACRVGGVVGIYSAGSLIYAENETVDIPIFVGDVKDRNTETRVGGIVGQMGTAGGTKSVENFTYSGEIDAPCASTFNSSLGGIVGNLYSKQSLANCTMSGTINTNMFYVGGLVGEMAGGVIDNTNQVNETAVIIGGSYVGGVIGKHQVLDTGSHVDIMENKVNVSGISCVGGIAGTVIYGHTFDMSNRKNSGTIEGSSSYVGGLVGLYQMGNLLQTTGCTNTGTVSGRNYTGGIFGQLQANDKTKDYVFKNHVNTGDVLANTESVTCLGGIVGKAVLSVKLQDCRNEGIVGTKQEYYGVSSIGGIIGKAQYNFTAIGCSNAGDIIGYGMVGGIIGQATGGNIIVTMEDCINERTASVLATGSKAGGIAGEVLGRNSEEDFTQIKNCVNYGEIDAPVRSSGIIAINNMAKLEVEDCHNYGDIGLNFKGIKTVYGVGGIVGYTAGREARIVDCTQNANIYAIGCGVGHNSGNYNGAGAGGIICSVTAPLVMENCFYGSSTDKYTIFYETSGNRTGGLVAATGQSLTMINCSSYADISGEGGAQAVGGLVGMSSGQLLTIGEEGNPDTYCHFYGDIDGKGSLYYIGGIIGYIGNGTGGFEIYGSTNYGIIGKSSANIFHVGGIIGYCYGNSNQEVNGILEECTQLGQIYQARASVGGLIGNNYLYSLMLTNCHNGHEDVADSGNIYTYGNSSNLGGLIGNCTNNTKLAPSGRKLEIKSSNNYGDIFCYGTTAQRVGGLVGYMAGIDATLGEEGNLAVACHNYGNISSSTGVKGDFIGGLIGQGHDPYGGEKYGGTLYIHSSVNYGNIGSGMSSLNCGGGIVGLLHAEGVIKDSTNLGTLGETKLVYCGGIAGAVNSFDYVIENCSNGSAGDWDKGILLCETSNRVGGIVGQLNHNYDEDSFVLTIVECTNYAQIRSLGNAGKVGGICGTQERNSLIIEACQNNGTIICQGQEALCIGGILGYQSGGSVQIGATDADGNTDMDRICLNYGELQFMDGCVGRYVGGILGNVYNGTISATVSIYGACNEADIVPDNEGSVVTNAGGIAGYIYGTTLLQDVKQKGNISHVVYNNAKASAGGIVGYLAGTATLRDCENGSSESRANGEISGSITLEKYSSGTDPFIVGGIIGSNDSLLKMENCSNYGDISTANSIQRMGGIIGNTKAGAILLSCNNYGTLSSERRMIEVGGLIGRLTNEGSDITILGDSAETAKACNNYGDIIFGDVMDTEGMRSSGIGGVIGKIYKPVNVYNSENNGNIRSNSGGGEVWYVGGIIGEAVTSSSSLLHGCVNKGIISDTTAGAGGIIGLAQSGFTLIECVNGAEGASSSEAGRIHARPYARMLGGIVGSGIQINMQSCINYADIVGSVKGAGNLTYTGGLIGDGANVTLGNEAEGTGQCINYGDICTDSQLQYVGGIAGQLTQTVNLYNCLNTGAVGAESYYAAGVGGIIGNLYGADARIISCANEGNMLAGSVSSQSQWNFVGGIVGRMYDGSETRTVLVDSCLNKGQIGRNDENVTQAKAGGIVGAGYGTIQNCTNLGKIYSLAGSGGIIAHIYNEGKGNDTCIITGCINGAEGDEEAGMIQVIHRGVTNIGGVAGGVNTETINTVQVADCINYADIKLRANMNNANIGGVVGCMAYATDDTNTLEILRCINYGDIENVVVGGGIAGKLGGTSYMISDSINYGNLQLTTVSGVWTTVGGIVGDAENAKGGIIHCINAGDITGTDNLIVGGLAGSFYSTYLIDSYNLGHITGGGADLVGELGGDGYFIDCYSRYSDCGKLYTVAATPNVITDEHAIWQATNASGTAGYLDETTYNTLCDVFGITPSWSEDDYVENVMYLTANYKYASTTPVGSDFTYVPADEQNGMPSQIQWTLQNADYYAAEGIEIWLYDSSMADVDIIADTSGSLAFFQDTVSFLTGAITSTISVAITEEQLPTTETTYKVVIKTLGYSTSEGTVITEDTERVIQGDTLTLPAIPVE